MSGRREFYRQALRSLQTATEEGRQLEVAECGAAEDPRLETCIVALETAIQELGERVGYPKTRTLIGAVLDLTCADEHLKMQSA